MFDSPKQPDPFATISDTERRLKEQQDVAVEKMKAEAACEARPDVKELMGIIEAQTSAVLQAFASITSLREVASLQATAISALEQRIEQIESEWWYQWLRRN
jgi:hypothetical protein